MSNNYLHNAHFVNFYKLISSKVLRNRKIVQNFSVQLFRSILQALCQMIRYPVYRVNLVSIFCRESRRLLSKQGDASVTSY